VWNYNEMGVFFYSRGAYDLAISEFKHALKASLFPVPQVHMNLGAAYLGKKLYTEAEAALRESVRLDPNCQKARMLLARALLAHGDRARALQEFERAHALDPATEQGHVAADEIRRLRASKPAEPSLNV
jgi:Tfp pilus assembly protein PilF